MLRVTYSSWEANDVTKRAPRDDMVNVTQTAQGALQDFDLYLTTELMLQSYFQA